MTCRACKKGVNLPEQAERCFHWEPCSDCQTRLLMHPNPDWVPGWRSWYHWFDKFFCPRCWVDHGHATRAAA